MVEKEPLGLEQATRNFANKVGELQAGIDGAIATYKRNPNYKTGLAVQAACLELFLEAREVKETSDALVKELIEDWGE